MEVFRTGLIESKVKARIHLPPMFSVDIQKGIQEKMSQLILKYSHTVGGVILCYENVKILNKSARILYDSPYLNFSISADILSFSPKIGTVLSGTISKQSAGHIALLIYGVLNATICAEDLQGYYWSSSEYSWMNQSGSPVEMNSEMEFKVKE